MTTKACQDCKKNLPKSSHSNRKRCKKCAAYRAAHPAHGLSPEHQVLARRLAGTMYYEKLAKHIGCTRSGLSRFARQSGFSLNHHAYDKKLVAKVIKFYSEHGKPKTQKKFPEVSVRSIVERYKDFQPRCLRWTDEQILEATKMAGLVSFAGQAKYFNRPRANIGSIRSLWMKRFGFGSGSLNGMAHWTAKNFVTSNARYLKPTGLTRQEELVEFKRLILWVDMEQVLKDDAPEFVKEAVKTMADFQRWIWKSKNPKPLILKMIKEREL